MNKITLIAMGKLKEKYLVDAFNEYTKRLSRYCKIDVVEVEPIRISDNPSEAEVDNVLEREAQLILKKIPPKSTVISLCVEGTEMTSPQFAKRLKASFDLGENITFIIGSSYGLCEKIKKISTLRISLSQMTFPHQLFRVMLAEQIYRAFKINEGSTYHK